MMNFISNINFFFFKRSISNDKSNFHTTQEPTAMLTLRDFNLFSSVIYYSRYIFKKFFYLEENTIKKTY